MRSIGQHTDDSQLAGELVQSYIASGAFDPQVYAERIAAIFAEGRIEQGADNRLVDLHVWHVGPRAYAASLSVVSH